MCLCSLPILLQMLLSIGLFVIARLAKPSRYAPFFWMTNWRPSHFDQYSPSTSASARTGTSGRYRCMTDSMICVSLHARSSALSGEDRACKLTQIMEPVMQRYLPDVPDFMRD